MKKMIISETDFVKVLMGNLYAYAPKFSPHDPELILSKARIEFRKMCDAEPMARGFYHLTIPISDLGNMLRNILMGIPEYIDNMSDDSDFCIGVFIEDFREMAIFDAFSEVDISSIR